MNKFLSVFQCLGYYSVRLKGSKSALLEVLKVSTLYNTPGCETQMTHDMRRGALGSKRFPHHDKC